MRRLQKYLNLFAGLALVVSAAAGPRQPNILFIAVDDLRPELGCYGKDYIKSPNIDALARTGMVFDQNFCQVAVCCPSRASMLTGLRPDTTKVYDNDPNFRTFLPDAVTLPEYFKKNGYFVQGMGKIFHHHPDDPQSWSVLWTSPPMAHSYYALPANQAIVQKAANKRGPAFECADMPDDTYHDGSLAEMAVKALRECAAKDRPFWLGVGFIRPHLPFNAPKKYWDLYDPEKIKLAPNPFYPIGAPSYAILRNSELPNYQGVPAMPIPDDYARQLKHGYFAAVSYVDTQVGKVLNELDRLGLRTNTIIVLWGDNGWKLGEHGAWSKQSNVENDTRVPLIFSVPGMKHAGAHTESLTELVDVYPTLCALAGLPIPNDLQGTSLVPVIQDPGKKALTAAFSQYPRKVKGRRLMGYSMRTERYRFTRWVEADDHAKVAAVELYDEQADPQENRNIVADPDKAKLVAQLTKELQAGWRSARCEDAIQTVSP
ncbi:MAG: sulfatase [Verrucomicrobia bacterium]|nr:sulfatase [Verrucomicrobiota bacterium]